MITYKIHILRTGSTADSPGKRYVGQTDLPLSQKGRAQLEAQRRELLYPDVDVVFSSPLRRCIQTSYLLYPDTQLLTIEDFKDMNLGSFEGKTFEALRGDEAFARWINNSFEYAPPGGEDTLSFTRRIVGALDEVFHYMMDERVTNAAVVTHGGVIMTLLAAAALPKLPLHQWSVANGAGYTLLMTPQMWMRDGAAEVYGFIPEKPGKDDMEMYGMYEPEQ